MTPTDVKNHFKSLYRFRNETGMSAATLANWLKWGHVPINAQYRLQQITDGKLTVTVEQKHERKGSV